ncbi:YrhK family protein [Enterococcus saccharolyticus]|uniref:YrhK domain-containing protein n=1 Tax=Candidatus Enterococcus willemsii TaxID=1857215 RepID=A0ABQ6YVX9_9ENTE|nr:MULTISPECIES: YrhK family protein [Enterococcus]KAF1301433.1 hypothetical protein BAU17_05775 [Enterococcus sp. CU12B]MCD5003081.1 YrhK family protein [Enterococcus saccharolyticus]
MPKIKKKTREIDKNVEEDIEIQVSRFKLYLQNRYNLISLLVDFLTGIFYVLGSIAMLTKMPDIYGTILSLLGGIFLTIRPILRIIKNVFIYKNKK